MKNSNQSHTPLILTIFNNIELYLHFYYWKYVISLEGEIIVKQRSCIAEWLWWLKSLTKVLYCWVVVVVKVIDKGPVLLSGCGG
jgi:hypothetical protein